MLRKGKYTSPFAVRVDPPRPPPSYPPTAFPILASDGAFTRGGCLRMRCLRGYRGIGRGSELCYNTPSCIAYRARRREPNTDEYEPVTVSTASQCSC
jgi:hypothetical protein